MDLNSLIAPTLFIHAAISRRLTAGPGHATSKNPVWERVSEDAEGRSGVVPLMVMHSSYRLGARNYSRPPPSQKKKQLKTHGWACSRRAVNLSSRCFHIQKKKKQQQQTTQASDVSSPVWSFCVFSLLLKLERSSCDWGCYARAFVWGFFCVHRWSCCHNARRWRDFSRSAGLTLSEYRSRTHALI